MTEPKREFKAPTPQFRSLYDFAAAVDELEPGWSVTYHIGNLAEDRFAGYSSSHVIHQIANEAMSLCNAGTVTLFQQRLDAETWQYLARKKPAKEVRK